MPDQPARPASQPAARRALKPATKPAAKKPASTRPPIHMEKPDPLVAERLAAAMEGLPVYRRSMFGGVAWFVEENAQMFAGVWGDALDLRVGVEDVAALVAAGKARPFEPMEGRPMREYVLVPVASMRPSDYKRWVARALAFTSTLARKNGK